MINPGQKVTHETTGKVGLVLSVSDNIAYVEFQHDDGIRTYGDLHVDSLKEISDPASDAIKEAANE